MFAGYEQVNGHMAETGQVGQLAVAKALRDPQFFNILGNDFFLRV